MKQVDKFSEMMLVSAISMLVVALTIALILFGYILIRKIIQKNKGRK